MALPAWNAGFSRHALRDSAAHGATLTSGVVSFCAPTWTDRTFR